MLLGLVLSPIIQSGLKSLVSCSLLSLLSLDKGPSSPILALFSLEAVNHPFYLLISIIILSVLLCYLAFLLGLNHLGASDEALCRLSLLCYD
jgi:hypothetical protein